MISEAAPRQRRTARPTLDAAASRVRELSRTPPCSEGNLSIEIEKENRYIYSWWKTSPQLKNIVLNIMNKTSTKHELTVDL